ncbi:hypothetical protein [Gordonia liuliyuniae]|uniref:Uncharacterized protein n=1 Tax=Gordonia liuliyuniae TaxID=2911517 RepID=A0ABS9ITV5_9ACTN|nr:hypothetical protein [Gordonia liuliyuniae]MCF8589006.1 hypothetical protein [Gordonia liuliyuniae]
MSASDPGIRGAPPILVTGQADVVLIGRHALRDLHFPVRAEKDLRRGYGYVPPAYHRAFV